MKKVSNQIMLITYSDSIGSNISDMHRILKKYAGGSIGGIHLLPFFPSSGDRGFAPMTYREVDKAFGDWNDISALSEDYYLMVDYMINHISARSEYYKNFLAKKDFSPYRDLFIRYKEFWQDGEPTAEQIGHIYKRKPRSPSVKAHFSDGSIEDVWCTFDEEQIDINCYSETGKLFLKENLEYLAKRGISIIRLDAFAYATKKRNTNCFFVEPDVWDLLNDSERLLKPYKVVILPEIHEHYTIQLKIAEKGYYVYDFALPILLIHALYYGQAKYLKNWLSICPKKQFTTLDTHDGIGIVDVKDLIPDSEIERTREDIFRFGSNVKKKYSASTYNNLDIYQVNCTYYSALGGDDDAYLTARAVQFFAPGIPQVYYVGMFAGKNDINLMEKTKVGRDINRHYYTEGEIAKDVKRPVVQRLLHLMEFRNTCAAFDGSFEMLECGENELYIRRQCGEEIAELKVNFRERSCIVSAGSCGQYKTVFVTGNPP
jgi:sucrose phosphorylase